MKYYLALSILVLASCSSTPGAVNPDPASPYTLFMPTSNETLPEAAQANERSTKDYMERAPNVAIAGQAILGDPSGLPRPLSRLSLRLSQKVDGKWKYISDMNTETDGSFKVTRKLFPGTYRLMSLDKRFKGDLEFTLESRPREDLMLSLHEITM